MNKTTIYLPKEMHAALEQIARRKKRPQAQVIREALAEYIALQERPESTSMGMYSNAGVTSETIEDWLEANWQPE